MKRSLLCLVLALGALSACKDKPPGQLEPIARPADYKDPPKPEASKPPPPPDPNKVTLRWKLAEGAPLALRLDGLPSSANLYVLQRPKSEDLTLRVAAVGGKAAPEQGTFSERGFILDGLGNADRNLATLMLELPKEPVAKDDTWTLGGIDLVDTTGLGRDFTEKDSERHNTVKLSALAPEGDDRIATIDYDILERVSGNFRHPAADDHGHEETQPLRPAKGKGKAKEAPKEAPKSPANGTAVTEVKFIGHGEFLVKAGRWRSWEGTLTTKTEGYTPAPDKSAAQVPPGELKLKLTALDSVPPELQQPEAKK